MEQMNDFRQSLPSWKSLRNMQPRAKRDFRLGMLFISPWLIGFAIFTLIPMLATFLFTFLNLRITDGLMNPLTFVGLQNYVTMVNDPQPGTS